MHASGGHKMRGKKYQPLAFARLLPGEPLPDYVPCPYNAQRGGAYGQGEQGCETLACALRCAAACG